MYRTVQAIQAFWILVGLSHKASAGSRSPASDKYSVRPNDWIHLVSIEQGAGEGARWRTRCIELIPKDLREAG